jgi:hypothetical protein
LSTAASISPGYAPVWQPVTIIESWISSYQVKKASSVQHQRGSDARSRSRSPAKVWVSLLPRSQDALKAAAERIRAETDVGVIPIAADITTERVDSSCWRPAQPRIILINNARRTPARRLSACDARGLDPCGRCQYAYADLFDPRRRWWNGSQQGQLPFDRDSRKPSNRSL